MESERRRNRELQFAPLVSETENKKKIVLMRLSCSSFIFLESDSISWKGQKNWPKKAWFDEKMKEREWVIAAVPTASGGLLSLVASEASCLAHRAEIQQVALPTSLSHFFSRKTDAGAARAGWPGWTVDEISPRETEQSLITSCRPKLTSCN